MSSAVRPTGTDACGRFGHGHQQVGALLLDGVELGFELLDLLPARLVGGKDGGRIESLLLRAGDFLARRVLIALEAFHLRDELAALRVERAERPEDRLGVEAPVLESGPNLVRVIANESGIEHG